MLRKIVGALVVASCFAGCGAEDPRAGGSPGGGESETKKTEQAYVGCASVHSSLDEHVAAGRATVQTTTFFIWTFRAYYAKGLPGAAAEYLGSEGTADVALSPANVQATAWTADASKCVNTGVCGDGYLDVSEFSDEPCEGTQLGRHTCQTEGFPKGGTLKCSPTCALDTSGCISDCGNGKVDPGEDCDGSAPVACTSLGGFFKRGTASCVQCHHDTSTCFATNCGDGVVDDASEACDGNALRSDLVGKQCKDITNPNPAWPFGNTVNFASGAITCSALCAIQCPPLPGCYYEGAVHLPYQIRCY
jgi:hypothetical protein